MGGRPVLRACLLASLGRPQQPRRPRPQRLQAAAPEAGRRLDCSLARIAVVPAARGRGPPIFSGRFEPGLVGRGGDAASATSTAPWVYGHLRNERGLVGGLGREPHDCHAVSVSLENKSTTCSVCLDSLCLHTPYSMTALSHNTAPPFTPTPTLIHFADDAQVRGER